MKSITYLVGFLTILSLMGSVAKSSTIYLFSIPPFTIDENTGLFSEILSKASTPGLNRELLPPKRARTSFLRNPRSLLIGSLKSVKADNTLYLLKLARISYGVILHKKLSRRHTYTIGMLSGLNHTKSTIEKSLKKKISITNLQHEKQGLELLRLDRNEGLFTNISTYLQMEDKERFEFIKIDQYSLDAGLVAHDIKLLQKVKREIDKIWTPQFIKVLGEKYFSDPQFLSSDMPSIILTQ